MPIAILFGCSESCGILNELHDVIELELGELDGRHATPPSFVVSGELPEVSPLEVRAESPLITTLWVNNRVNPKIKVIVRGAATTGWVGPWRRGPVRPPITILAAIIPAAPATVSARACGLVKILLTRNTPWLTITFTMKENAKKKMMGDREFGVILEKIYSEFKIFGEGLAGLREKVDTTMGMVAKTREDITMLNMRTDGIKSDINKISGKLVQIEEDIRMIKNDIRTIKEDFGKRIAHLEEVK
jgi:hypothetical protein